MKLGMLRALTAGVCAAAAASQLGALPAQAAAGARSDQVGPLLLAWGSNVFGQLGDGTVMDRLVPVCPARCWRSGRAAKRFRAWPS